MKSALVYNKDGYEHSCKKDLLKILYFIQKTNSENLSIVCMEITQKKIFVTNVGYVLFYFLIIRVEIASNSLYQINSEQWSY